MSDVVTNQPHNVAETFHAHESSAQIQCKPSLWRGDHPLILASSSHIRLEILNNLRLYPEVFTSKIDECATILEEEAALNFGHQRFHLAPEMQALTLAKAKAASVSQLKPNQIVLGADQVLSLEGCVFHKASNFEEAHKKLTRLQGKTHQLHAAAALYLNGKCLFADFETASLKMRMLNAHEITYYLNAALPECLHAVGCYEIESIGQYLFDEIHGATTTIMGLPVLRLLQYLRENNLIAF